MEEPHYVTGTVPKGLPAFYHSSGAGAEVMVSVMGKRHSSTTASIGREYVKRGQPALGNTMHESKLKVHTLEFGYTGCCCLALNKYLNSCSTLFHTSPFRIVETIKKILAFPGGRM